MVRKIGRSKMISLILVISIVTLCVYIGFEIGKKWERYQYVRVVDGDTIVVRNLRNGEEQRLRIVGINAPDVKDCYFEESGNLLKKYLNGRKMEYKFFGKDSFGRLLGIVYIDKVDVSQIMVSTGAALAYDAKDVHDDLKPADGYFSFLKKMEEEPKAKKLGVWSDLCLK